MTLVGRPIGVPGTPRIPLYTGAMVQRSDATENRKRLIEAAESVFSEHGPNAPLQLVADLAGVGRGTLYRHFPDRIALVVALFELRLESFQQAALSTSGDPREAERILLQTLRQQQLTPGLTRLVLATGDTYRERLESLTAGLERALEGPIRYGKAAGRVHEDVEPGDFLVSWAMYEGVTSTYSEPHYAERLRRSRKLILRSILLAPALAEIEELEEF